MIQIDGTRLRVYLKFSTSKKTHAVLKTSGKIEYRHDNDELSTIFIEPAGMGTRLIRIFNLSPEMPDCTTRDAVSMYGDVKDIREETRSSAYRHPVSNGRVAVTYLKNTFRPTCP